MAENGVKKEEKAPNGVAANGVPHPASRESCLRVKRRNMSAAQVVIRLVTVKLECCTATTRRESSDA